MKKALSISLALTLVFSLCACSGTSESATGSDTMVSASESIQPEGITTPAEPSQEESVEESAEESDLAIIEFEDVVSEDATDVADAVPATVTETDYMSIDGIFVDESYVDDESESLRMVYLFYSVTTSGNNLKVDSVSTDLTIGGTNTYSAEHYVKSTRNMPSYYYSSYLEDVYVGDTLKVVETFKIPVGDLSEGKTITLEKSQVPDTQKISLCTDDIIFCESTDAIAQIVDPDGYAIEVYNRTPADESTVSAVKSAINGYYWSVYVNSTSYELEFFAPDSFEMRVNTLGITNSGTYEVQNGYIVCTYTDTGLILEIPYSWGADDIELEIIDALDVKEG